LHGGAFTRSEKLKLAAVLYKKLLAGAFGNKPSPLAPKKKHGFPTKFQFHEYVPKHMGEHVSEAGPHSIAFKPTLR
jgi:hypothetical protein